MFLCHRWLISNSELTWERLTPKSLSKLETSCFPGALNSYNFQPEKYNKCAWWLVQFYCPLQRSKYDWKTEKRLQRVLSLDNFFVSKALYLCSYLRSVFVKEGLYIQSSKSSLNTVRIYKLDKFTVPAPLRD